MDKQTQYQSLVADIKQHQCSLRAGCKQAVPGDGNIDSPVVFIGEGPGKVEDEMGVPFVGPAGKLLAEGLAQIGWNREDIYITNVVKCRPPNNRDPLPEEVEEHKPFLTAELELIQPKLIILLGRHALHWFLPELSISQVHGQSKRHGSHVFFPVYHPAAALYDPRLRETFFADIKKIPLVLDKLESLETPVSTSPTQPSIF